MDTAYFDNENNLFYDDDMMMMKKGYIFPDTLNNKVRLSHTFDEVWLYDFGEFLSTKVPFQCLYFRRLK